MNLVGYEVGLDKPFFLIAGPCGFESRSMIMDIAAELKSITDELQIPFIFKSSFDKANLCLYSRTSVFCFHISKPFFTVFRSDLANLHIT